MIKDIATWKNSLAIKNIVDKNPYATLQEIGNAIGVTRERVRQIINQVNKEAKLDPNKEPIVRIPHNGGAFKAYCIKCGKQKTNVSRSRYEKGSKMCRECRKAKPIVFFCAYCGKKTVKSTPEEIRTWKQNKKRAKNPSINLCSKKCSGHWIGINVGFGKQ